MKKLLTLLSAVLLCSIVAKAEGITAISELRNSKLYHVTQPHHSSGAATSWVIVSESSALQSTPEYRILVTETDPNQLFAFISNDGGASHYLYHPVRKVFVNRTGEFSDTPQDPIFFTEGAYENTFVAYFDNAHFINIDNVPMMLINDWGPGGRIGVADGGNSCCIAPAGDFDPTEALSKFATNTAKNVLVLKPGAHGWLEGTEVMNEQIGYVGYISDVYRFKSKVETVRLTVVRTKGGTKYFSLADLAFYDENGQKIELTEANITSNADHNALNPNNPDGGGIAALLDNSASTYFHSAWVNKPAEDHYLEVTLPNGGYDAFRFRMLSRTPNQGHIFPAEMIITASADFIDSPSTTAVTKLEEAQPTKSYTIASYGRGAWAVDAAGTRLSCTDAQGLIPDATDPRQQFAIISANARDYYLYSVGAKKFVNKDGSLVYGVADAIAFTDASAVEEGRVMVSFRDHANTYINIDNRFHDLVVSWWGNIDDGNAVLISPAADFDAAHALAMLTSEMDALMAQARDLIEANADNHAAKPAIGQYSTEAYKKLAFTADSAGASVELLRETIDAFEATKCMPVFTIDGVYSYAKDMSIYESEEGALLWKENNPSEKTMLWAFDIAQKTVGTGSVMVRNVGTGNLFGGAPYIKVTETSENIADDGIFLFYIKGAGDPVHAQEVGQCIVHWSDMSANSASAWKFSYVGTTYDLFEVPDTIKPEVPDTIKPNVPVGDYLMRAQDVKARTSSVVILPVEMKNATAVTAFQFDLYLPEGASVATFIGDGEEYYDITLNNDRQKSSHIVAAEPLADGAMRIVAYSSVNAAFAGNEGVLVNVSVAVGEMEEGEYPVTMRNIRMVTSDEQEMVAADCTSTLTIENTIMGDVNGDRRFTMIDVVMMVNAVLEKQQNNFDSRAADLNGDNKVTMVDVVGVLRLVLTADSAKAPVRRAATEAENNAVAISDVALKKGESAVISVELNNETAFTSFQMDLQLPDGFKVATMINEDEEEVLDIALSAARKKSTHTLSYNDELADGAIRIVSYSTANATYKGNTGEIVQIRIEATDDAVAGSCKAMLRNILFTTAEPVGYELEDVEFQIDYSTEAPGYSVAVQAGQHGSCIVEGNLISLGQSLTVNTKQGDAIKLYFVPTEGYTARSMRRNGEVVAIHDNMYEETAVENVSFTDVEYTRASDTIFITETIATPVITCEDGVVTITCDTDDAVILYAIDGDPMEGSVYTAPFEVKNDAVISAVAVRRSQEATLAVKGNGVAQSQMRVVSRRYYSENGVEVSAPVNGVTIVATEYEDGSTRVYKVVSRGK